MAESAVFKDHFSGKAHDYTRYRPTYPPQLFCWLADRVEHHDLAWDCGCGSGQASPGLARHFSRVIATDPSRRQIESAPPCDNVSYAVAAAEDSGINDKSVDLIVAAQALHWFDFERFYAEARRVARPGAVLAAISYGEVQVEGAPHEAVSRFYHGMIAPFWPPERRHVDQGYASIPFPFDRISPPSFVMDANWTLDRLLGYLGTWSAVGEYERLHGSSPLDLITPELADAWGEPCRERKITWPLTVLAGRL